MIIFFHFLLYFVQIAQEFFFLFHLWSAFKWLEIFLLTFFLCTDFWTYASHRWKIKNGWSSRRQVEILCERYSVSVREVQSKRQASKICGNLCFCVCASALTFIICFDHKFLSFCVFFWEREQKKVVFCRLQLHITA